MIGNSVPVDSIAETGPDAIVRRAFAIDAACEAYWNDWFADGWSWREMSDGRAGNNAEERETGVMHADQIRSAIEDAIDAYHRAGGPVSAQASAGRETK